MTSKYILIPTVTASLLLLVGCTTQTATNTNAVSNTNTTVNANTTINTNTTTNDNTNGKVVANTNVVVNSNENTNSEQLSEVDVGEWQTYSNEVIGLQFDYPMPSNNMYFDFTDCSEVQCDSETGFSYSLSFFDEETSTGYAVAGATTLDFVAGRGLSYFDVVFFRNNSGNFEAVFSKDNRFTINPVKQASYANGEVVIYEVKDLPGYNQLVDVAIERKDDKVAIYNFNRDVNGFKSISVLLTPEMTEQDIDRILTSIAIL